MDTFDNDFYQDGFLVKEVSIATMLTTDDVNPSLDEINRFSSVAGEDGEHRAEDMLASVEGDDWKNKVEHGILRPSILPKPGPEPCLCGAAYQAGCE